MVPGEAAGEPMAPYYVLMALPGESEQHFMLMQPYTPRNKDNMISWVAALSDPGVYGRRVVFEFPKQRLIIGPMQVRARINQEPDISSKLTLLNQQGSRVRFGNLLVIPIEESIVYIEPLYLQASQSPMPELKYVVVAYDDKVSMAPDLATALIQVFGAAPSTAKEAVEGGSLEGTGAAKTGAARETAPAREQDAKLARTLYERAVKAQREGDWTAYGKALDELGVVLRRMSAGSR